VPVHTDNANLIGSFKGKIKGNILSTGIQWNAEILTRPFLFTL
jgi:hypothetical protein